MEYTPNKFSQLVGDLEQISEDQHGMLVGGFASVGGESLAYQAAPNVICPQNTNCGDANCSSTCGKTPG
jgi:hypothetical protein